MMTANRPLLCLTILLTATIARAADAPAWQSIRAPGFWEKRFGGIVEEYNGVAWLRAAVAIGPPSMVAAWFARLLRHDATPRRPVELLAGLVGWQMAPLRWLIERYGRAIAIPLHAVAWAGVWALPFAI